MGEAALTFGKGGTIEYEGKRYEYTPLTLDDLALFEVFCEEAAWRKVERLQGRADPAAYQRRVDATARLIASNAFGVFSDGFNEVWESDAGRRYSFFLSLLRKQPDMTEELANRIFDANRAVAMAKMAVANGQGDGDPNASTPGADPPG